MENNKLVSIIIPVYNTGKLLCRCLDSLIIQTYRQLEIIAVNDASTDNSADILKEYTDRDNRIKYVEHDINRGLFQARITGVQASSGEYIAFVDSDDYVSCDWIRTLVSRAEETKSDIVVGEWCFENEEHYREYISLDPFRANDYMLEGEEVLKQFMAQAGRCFSWHVVWNKLYSKRLWDLCENDFVGYSNEHGHMLMWEDVVYSSGFWSAAKRVSNAHGVNYYYYQHSGASTSLGNRNNRKRNEKYIQDASSAMKFMQNILKKRGLYETVEKDYLDWKKRYVSMVYRELVVDLGISSYKQPIIDKFDYKEEFDINTGNINSYFYDNKTQLQDSFDVLEELKKNIVSDQIKIVSFDVFDTLVQRPFFEPGDLFSLLSARFNKIVGTSSYVDFAVIRKDAESQCRKICAVEHPSIEDITLDEIYQYIEKNYVIPASDLESLKAYEIELEYHFCRTRKIGKDLYRLAAYAGKKIIICSDMYLPLESVEKILKNNQYDGYDKIYLSSDVKLCKWTGRLFDYAAKDQGIHSNQRNQLLHIGDTWDSDVIQPQQKGWKSAHFPKSIDMFKNGNGGIYSGEIYTRLLINSFHNQDTYWAGKDFTGFSCVQALIANKIFDNPFVSFNKDTDFNINPYMIGYAALGPHLLALVNWLADFCREDGTKKVHFVARDGYLVKKAFDIIENGEIQSNYLRLSRKSLLLADVRKIEDLYSISTKSNIIGMSPKKLEKYMEPVLNEGRLEKVHDLLKKEKIAFDRKFVSLIEYNKALKGYIENALDFSKLENYKQEMKEYFSTMINQGDVLFDVGYSGRPESALADLLGFPVNSYYIHTNSDVAEKRQRMHGCKCKTFYDYKPVITGVMREHLLMELGPSTIGYQKHEDTLEPEFENYSIDYTVRYVTNTVQEAALDFIRDYVDVFGAYREDLKCRPQDLSCIFEYYLHNSKPLDREPFSTLEFEDDMKEGKTLRALDFWNTDIYNRVHEMTSYTPAANSALNDLYADGLFVKFYQAMNKALPYGSGRRNMIKKMAHIFVH